MMNILRQYLKIKTFELAALPIFLTQREDKSVREKTETKEIGSESSHDQQFEPLNCSK